MKKKLGLTALNLVHVQERCRLSIHHKTHVGEKMMIGDLIGVLLEGRISFSRSNDALLLTTQLMRIIALGETLAIIGRK